MKIFQTNEVDLEDMGVSDLREELTKKILADRVFGGVVLGMVLGGLFVSMVWSASWPDRSNIGDCTAKSSGLCWAAEK